MTLRNITVHLYRLVRKKISGSLAAKCSTMFTVTKRTVGYSDCFAEETAPTATGSSREVVKIIAALMLPESYSVLYEIILTFKHALYKWHHHQSPPLFHSEFSCTHMSPTLCCSHICRQKTVLVSQTDFKTEVRT